MSHNTPFEVVPFVPTFAVSRTPEGDGFTTAISTQAGYLMEIQLLEEGPGKVEILMDVQSTDGTMDGLGLQDVRNLAEALKALANAAERWKGAK